MATIPLSDWMKQAKLDDKKLHQLCIPGTHDSGTFPLPQSGVEDQISKTQKSTIFEQLNLGIRFFDIRVNADNMQINHGKTATGLLLSEVLQIFWAFFQNHPGEVVVMHVKHEWGVTKGFHTKMVDAIKAIWPDDPNDPNCPFAKHVYMKPMGLNSSYPIPTISQLRGKLVYMRRYGVDKREFITKAQQDGPESGIPVDSFALGTDYNAWSKNHGGQTWQQRFDTLSLQGWPDNGGNFDVAHIDFRNRHGISFVIQDWYSIGPAHGSTYPAQCESKIASVKIYRDSASSEFPDSWYLNFVNVTQTAYYPIEYAVGDGRCNSRLRTMFTVDAPTKQRGTFPLDYCESPSDLTDVIAVWNN
jgi:hypothetical protein